MSYEWIRERVCSIDGASAPQYFNCYLGGNHTYSPSPTTSPTTSDDMLEARLRSEGLAMIGSGGGGDFVGTKVEVAIEIFL